MGKIYAKFWPFLLWSGVALASLDPRLVLTKCGEYRMNGVIECSSSNRCSLKVLKGSLSEIEITLAPDERSMRLQGIPLQTNIRLDQIGLNPSGALQGSPRFNETLDTRGSITLLNEGTCRAH